MRILLFVLILFVSNTTVAQRKLKFDITSSGDTSYKTPEVKIYTRGGAPKAIGETLSSTIYKTNETYMLAFFIRTGRASVFSIGEGATAELTLGDGTKVTLRSLIYNGSKSSSIDYGSFVTGYYKIPAGNVALLKKSPVTFIRINASVGPMDYELKAKYSTTLAEQLEKLSGY